VTVEILQVAEYYQVDPDAVSWSWTMPDFLDRQEWMWLRTRPPRKEKR
jgi:hypothetical protein